MPIEPRSGPRMMPTKRVLLFAFGGVVASFVAATGYAEYRAAAIDSLAADLAERTSPSIEHLASARTQIRNLQEVVSELAAGARDPAAQRRADDSEERLDTEVRGYVEASPSGSAEAASREVVRAAGELRAAANSALHQAPARARGVKTQTGIDEVMRSADHAADVVLAAIQVDAEHARDAAQQIRAIRKRSQLTAFALDSVCAAFAALAFALAFASHRTHTALLERRSEELEQFAGRVAHDILSPLSTVRLALDRQLRAGHGGSPDEMIVRASRSVSRVQLIIDGLLLFAKAGAQPDPHARSDVSEVVTDVVVASRPAAEAGGIDLRVQAAAGLAVGCSSGVLMSVVSNLVNNAIKYIGTPQKPCIDVQAFLRDGFVRIEVEDNGGGISDDTLPTIFEPYVRGRGVQQSGIGLGLATVKRIVQAHRGTVGVDSEVGRGSRFWVELPRAEARPGSADPPEGRASAQPPEVRA